MPINFGLIVAQTSQPTPAMAGKGTAALVVALVIIVTSILTWHWRTELITWAREKAVFRTITQFLEPVLALLLTIFAGLFGLWKLETWAVVSTNLLIGTALESFVFSVYVALKVIGSEAKERDVAKMNSLQQKVNELEGAVLAQKDQVLAYEKLHGRCLEIILNARKVVSEKLKRLIAVGDSKDQLGCLDVLL